MSTAPLGHREEAERAPRARADAIASAVADLVEGARHWPQWFTLGNLEIRLRFRRTGLGPIWTALSFALLVSALSLVYSRILHLEARAYAPYLSLGLLVWLFFATAVQEACDAFVHAAAVLKQIHLPRSVFLYRLLWRNSVLFGINCVVAAVVLAICRVPLGTGALLALPGFLLLSANLFWGCFLLALLGARFWAVSRAVQASLPLAMLVTPVIWHPAQPGLLAIARWNPLYFLIELVRGPLLGAAPAPAVWIGVVAAALLGGALTLIFFSSVRRRIPYWL